VSPNFQKIARNFWGICAYIPLGMKLRTFFTLSLAAFAAVSFVPSVSAQEEGASKKTEKKARAPKLTPEELQKLNEVRNSVAADPAVVAADQDYKAANKAYNEAFKKAIADKPRIAELFQKRADATPQEKKEYAALVKELNAAEPMKSFFDKRAEATQALVKALKEAIVKADPSAADLVEKATNNDLVRGFKVARPKKQEKAE